MEDEEADPMGAKDPSTDIILMLADGTADTSVSHSIQTKVLIVARARDTSTKTSVVRSVDTSISSTCSTSQHFCIYWK